MTIEQIQSAIDEKGDLRQIVNMIADYLQANIGGGGSSLLPLSGTANATGNVTGNLNGHNLTVSGETELIDIEAETAEGQYAAIGLGLNSIDDTPTNSAYIYSEIEGSKKAVIYALADVSDQAYIKMQVDDSAQTGQLNVYVDGISTNGGGVKWMLKDAHPASLTPDSYVLVTVNGTDYKLSAQEVIPD